MTREKHRLKASKFIGKFFRYSDLALKSKRYPVVDELIHPDTTRYFAVILADSDLAIAWNLEVVPSTGQVKYHPMFRDSKEKRMTEELNIHLDQFKIFQPIVSSNPNDMKMFRPDNFYKLVEDDIQTNP